MSVPGGDRRQRRTDHLDQGFSGPGFGLRHKPLYLRGGLLEVEVRGVGWPVDEPATSLLDQLVYPLSLMNPEVVHHHHLTLTQRGRRTCSKYVKTAEGLAPSAARESPRSPAP